MIRAIEHLAESLSGLPTIGKKSAWRLALYLVDRPAAEAQRLAQAILDVKERVTTCKRCFNYAEGELCSVCASKSREDTVICVVEKPMDVFTLESSGRFRGLYHVLGGVLSPINGITADKLNVSALLSRVETEKPREIILGLGGSADAETTSLYLSRILQDRDVRVTRFARGLPAGMELEYVDQITLIQSLNERTEIRYGD